MVTSTQGHIPIRGVTLWGKRPVRLYACVVEERLQSLFE